MLPTKIRCKSINHQSGAKVDDENLNKNFFFEENLNYIQVGKGYLEFDIRMRKIDNTNFIVANDNTIEVIRLPKIAFAYTIHSSRLSTSAGTKIEQNKFVGPF